MRDATGTIETERLTLRRWSGRDLAPFAALNADRETMRYFPAPLTAAESDALVAHVQDRWHKDGFGFAVAERRHDRAFLGMVGLNLVRFAPMEGTVEVGWRLARAYWGQGYATEAARAWVQHGLGPLGLAEVVAFTVPGNLASRGVMRRLGLHRAPSRDFEHPRLPEGHPLRPHLVHVARRGEWTGAA